MEATVNVGAARQALNPPQRPAKFRKAPTSTGTPKSHQARPAPSLWTTTLSRTQTLTHDRLRIVRVQGLEVCDGE